MSESTLQVSTEIDLIDDEELIQEDKEIETENLEEKKIPRACSSDEYEPEVYHEKNEYIPLEYKKKCIDIIKAHPKWSLKTLQKNGCSLLRSKNYINAWEKDVQNGGTTIDKYSSINRWTYDRFIEARQNNHKVTTDNLQQWALSAAAQYPDLKFKASSSWMERFKRQHRIRRRKITKVVSCEDTEH